MITNKLLELLEFLKIDIQDTIYKKMSDQVPMEVGHHDDLQVDEIGEREIILHKQI